MTHQESLRIFSLTAVTDESQLKKRYRELIKMYHPDLNPGNPQWSTRTMQKLNTAYAILADSLKKSSPVLNELITGADEALKRSVLAGSLHRAARSSYALSHRTRIQNVMSHLRRLSQNPEMVASPRIEFFFCLFSVFLRATDLSEPLPLPAATNATEFFRRFSQASRVLEKGIGDYYHQRERNQLEKLGNIPLSYLDDSLGLFCYLTLKTRDKAYRKMIQARMELARLFQSRIRDPQVRWLDLSLDPFPIR